MSIRSARFENFTVFDHAEFTFSPGVNVLIGKNGTGKTHVLKALYGITEGSRRAYTDIGRVNGTSMRQLASNVLQNKSFQIFSTEQLVTHIFFSSIFEHQFLLNEKTLNLRRRKTNNNTNPTMLCETSIGQNSDKISISINSKDLNISAIPRKEN